MHDRIQRDPFAFRLPAIVKHEWEAAKDVATTLGFLDYTAAIRCRHNRDYPRLDSRNKTFRSQLAASENKWGRHTLDAIAVAIGSGFIGLAICASTMIF